MPKITINHTDRRIEGIYLPSGVAGSPSVLLVPPSLDEGGMNLAAMRALAKGFQNKGFSVFRFNYTAEGQELEDASLALSWFRRHDPDSSRVWIGGMAIGSWVALQLLMRRPDLLRFVVASLPVEGYDYSFLAPCPTSGLVIEAERDSHSTAATRDEFVAKLLSHRQVEVVRRVVKRADRLFSRGGDELTSIVKEYVEYDDKANFSAAG